MPPALKKAVANWFSWFSCCNDLIFKWQFAIFDARERIYHIVWRGCRKSSESSALSPRNAWLHLSSSPRCSRLLLFPRELIRFRNDWSQFASKLFVYGYVYYTLVRYGYIFDSIQPSGDGPENATLWVPTLSTFRQRCCVQQSDESLSLSAAWRISSRASTSVSFRREDEMTKWPHDMMKWMAWNDHTKKNDLIEWPHDLESFQEVSWVYCLIA